MRCPRSGLAEHDRGGSVDRPRHDSDAADDCQHQDENEQRTEQEPADGDGVLIADLGPPGCACWSRTRVLSSRSAVAPRSATCGRSGGTRSGLGRLDYCASALLARSRQAAIAASAAWSLRLVTNHNAPPNVSSGCPRPPCPAAGRRTFRREAKIVRSKLEPYVWCDVESSADARGPVLQARSPGVAPAEPVP